MRSLYKNNNQLESFSNHPYHCCHPGTTALTITVIERLYLKLSQFSRINEFSQILVCPCLLYFLLNQPQVISLGTTYMDTLKYYGMNKYLVYLQRDNYPKHKPKSTIAWLNNNAIRYINDQPAQSPDLNPIEHVWHHIKLNLSLYETRAKNVSELWDRIDIEWNKLDADTCRRYIDSMPDRIEAVIRAKGGYTFY